MPGPGDAKRAGLGADARYLNTGFWPFNLCPGVWFTPATREVGRWRLHSFENMTVIAEKRNLGLPDGGLQRHVCLLCLLCLSGARFARPFLSVHQARPAFRPQRAGFFESCVLQPAFGSSWALGAEEGDALERPHSSSCLCLCLSLFSCRHRKRKPEVEGWGGLGRDDDRTSHRGRGCPLSSPLRTRGPSMASSQ
ncbi:hypothetical protein GQ53DRAFT_443564 [Thozetella sp. PMI_491]|nr:hypothetical protein GQ53DRAFT_443564 [Thozetella sp. PMI_491]